MSLKSERGVIHAEIHVIDEATKGEYVMSEKKVVNNVVETVYDIFENDWSKQVILYGPPGTSKTYSAVIIAASFLAKKNGENKIKIDELKISHKKSEKYLEEHKEQYKLIQFHPSYSYEDFVRGIVVKPGENNENLTYTVESKIFEKFCEEKTEESKTTKVLIIDEINRAPLASVLGELIYGLEYRGKEIYTSYTLTDDKPLKVPENLYIIGTMNTADRSIGTIDYAVRRRFAFVQVPPLTGCIKDTWKIIGEKVETLYNELIDPKKGIFASKYWEDIDLEVEDIKIGHTYFLGKPEEKEEKEYLQYRIQYQVMPIYKEYIKDGMINKEGGRRFIEILEESKLFDEDFIENLKCEMGIGV